LALLAEIDQQGFFIDKCGFNAEIFII